MQRIQKPVPIKRMVTQATAIAVCFHIDAIEQENDKEMIKVHLACLDEIVKKQGVTTSARRLIRLGIREFGRVQEKCIEMEVV